MAWTDYYVDGAAGGGGDGSSGSPWTWDEMITDLSSNAGVGNRRYNCKGSVTRTGLDDFRSYDAAADNAVWIRGYTTTIGDGGLFTITNTGTSIPAIMLGDYYRLESLSVSQTVGREMIAGAVETRVIRCVLDNDSTDSGAHCMSGFDEIALCDITSAGGTAIVGFRSCHDSRIVHAGNGIDLTSTLNGVVIGCTFRGTGTPGNAIQASSGQRIAVISHNRIYNASKGIYIPSTTGEINVTVVQNLIYSVSSYGIDIGDTTPRMLLYGNLIGGATMSRYNGLGDFPVTPDVTLTADPFTDAANGDLSLNDIAGGGTLARADGFAINESYDWDNMEAQPTFEGSGGSGGGAIVNQGLHGIETGVTA